MKKINQPRIGEIYLVEFKGVKNEQQGIRPALIFQNNKGNQYSPNIIVLPLTTSLKKTNLPTHIPIKSGECGLKKDSMVLCENPICVSKERLLKYIGVAEPSLMSEIATANLLATSAISFIDFGLLRSIWEKAISLNIVAA